MTKHVEPGIVETFVEKRLNSGYNRPIPLKRTDYVIDIVGAFAIVTVTRLFRNEEKDPIEATLTFPAPFESVVTDLVTRIDGRTLVGKAVSKVKARETYEEAVDEGKAAVLHEELLRGLHMVSVANVAPGAEIEVEAGFVMPLSKFGADWRLRIPVTVGQVFGEVSLPESDAILTGGPKADAGIVVRTSSGVPLLRGDTLNRDGSGKVPLDRPIEIEVVGLDVAPVIGRAADGRKVSISTIAVGRKDAALSAEVMLDVSGSMTDPASTVRESGKAVSKWDVVRAGLIAAGKADIRADDHLRLWTFSDDCREIGAATGSDAFETLIRDCPFVSGGTELANAVAKVTASRSEANVLLITDGKSWRKIDVQAALATGARFTVVLVGVDSLEVNVGYLAAMSGGQMFAVSGSDADLAIAAAIVAMRDVASPARPIEGAVNHVDRTVGGVSIAADWTVADDAPARDGVAARLGAYAAGLALPGMNADEAAAFAAAEGIVSHLTSIVLVDEAGEIVDGLASTRKVALPSVATLSGGVMRGLGATYASALGDSSGAVACMSFCAMDDDLLVGADSAITVSKGVSGMTVSSPGIIPLGHGSGNASGGIWNDRLRDDLVDAVDEALDRFRRRQRPVAPAPWGWPSVFPTMPDNPIVGPYVLPRIEDLVSPVIPVGRVHIASSVWDASASAFSKGDLSALPVSTQAAIVRLSALPEVAALARALGTEARRVTMALLAEGMKESRGATRIARSILAKAPADLLEAARRAVQA